MTRTEKIILAVLGLCLAVGCAVRAVRSLQSRLQLHRVRMPAVTAEVVPPVPLQLDLNRATIAELDRLPGIGPKLARAIVDFRGRSGPFRSVDELLKVPGLGRSRFAKLRSHLFIGTQ